MRYFNSIPIKALGVLCFFISALCYGHENSPPSVPKTPQNLLEILKKSHHFSPPNKDPELRKALRYSDLEKGEEAYLPISWLQPGQASFSFLTVKSKIQTVAEEWGAQWDTRKARWNLPFDGQKALFPQSKSALVLLLSDSVLVLDGNHKVMTSLFFGAETMPVKIANNWSHLSLKEALPRLIENDLVFPFDPMGKTIKEWPSFTSIPDNPLRYLAAKLLLKCQIQLDEDKELQIKKARGSSNPVVCKLNRDLPFLELRMARVWKKSGIEFRSKDLESSPNELTSELVEAARNSLIEGRNKNGPEYEFLKEVLILESPLNLGPSKNLTEEERKKLLVLIQAHLETRKSCGALLADSYF